jgi:hypothetical protein
MGILTKIPGELPRDLDLGSAAFLAVLTSVAGGARTRCLAAG